jgi:predicted DNA-binding transcriptional regulator AlpA
MADEPGFLLSDHAGSALLGISRSTFWRRVADGTLPRPLKLGGVTRWRRTDLLAAINWDAARPGGLGERLIHGDPASGSLHHNAKTALLLEEELEQRWRLSVRTLQRWRRAGIGPAYMRLGRRVAYRLSDVERFEAERRVAGADW